MAESGAIHGNVSPCIRYLSHVPKCVMLSEHNNLCLGDCLVPAQTRVVVSIGVKWACRACTKWLGVGHYNHVSALVKVLTLGTELTLC